MEIGIDIITKFLHSEFALDLLKGVSVKALIELPKVIYNKFKSGVTDSKNLALELKRELPELENISNENLNELLARVSKELPHSNVNIGNINAPSQIAVNSPYTTQNLHVSTFDAQLDDNDIERLSKIDKSFPVTFFLASGDPKSYSLMESIRKFLVKNGYKVNSGSTKAFLQSDGKVGWSIENELPGTQPITIVIWDQPITE